MIDLDVIFRSVINFKNDKNVPTIVQQDLLKNFRAMQQTVPVAPEDKAYKVLYYFILDHVKGCQTAEIELPSYEFTRNHFESVEGNEAVLGVLEKIKGQQPYLGQDYRAVLKEYNEGQRLLQLERILSNSSKIATTGMEIGVGKNKIRVKGIMDSVSYFARETKDLQRDLTGVKTESQIVSMEDSVEVQEEYNKAKANPTESIGINTWLAEIDNATNGLKNTELMMVTAFTGHCKTTFSLNMAYRALYSGWNTAFVSLEMTFVEMRRHIYVLHACNPMFRDKLPQYKDLVGTITYNNVLYGRLNEREQKYWEIVCKDFDQNSNDKSVKYGRFFVWQPDKSLTTVSDVEFKMRQYQQELQIAGRDLDFSVIDYISLLGADKEERTRDPNETLNNIIKSLKRLCLTFNNGKGVRILSPHQANRDGYKEAKKNEGLYSLTSLSNAHEAERSCDLVLSIFKFDDENDNNRLKICCLKNRRNKQFHPFDACINFETGFIYNYSHAIEQSDNIDITAVVQ